jgi:hypothetical protein
MNHPSMEDLESRNRVDWARISRLLGLAGVALFLTAAFTPLPNILIRWLGTPDRLESP